MDESQMREFFATVIDYLNQIEPLSELSVSMAQNSPVLRKLVFTMYREAQINTLYVSSDGEWRDAVASLYENAVSLA